MKVGEGIRSRALHGSEGAVFVLESSRTTASLLVLVLCLPVKSVSSESQGLFGLVRPVCGYELADLPLAYMDAERSCLISNLERMGYSAIGATKRDPVSLNHSQRFRKGREFRSFSFLTKPGFLSEGRQGRIQRVFAEEH